VSEQEIPSSFPPPLPEPPETVVEELVFDARVEPVTPGGPPSTPDAPFAAAPPSVPPIPAQPGYLPPGYVAPDNAAPGYTTPGYVAPGYAAPGYAAPGYPTPGYAAPGYPPPVSAAPGYTDPTTAAPGYADPGFATPGYAAPVSAPGYPVSAPGYPAPVSAPGYPAPVSAPGYPAPVSAAPVYGAPVYPAPGGYAPGGYAPGGYAPGGYAPGGYAPGSVPPGYAPPGYPGFGGPGFPPPPPRRRKTGLFIGIGAIVLLLCAGLGVVFYSIGSKADKTLKAGAKATPTATTVPRIAPPPPPDPTTMNGSLALQGKALVAGDQAGWMAAVDPAARSAVAEYQRLFHNLHGMKVALWDQASAGGDEAPIGVEHYSIAATYCFLQSPCTKMTVTLPVTATLKAGRVVIESISVPKKNYETYAPFPWLTANLSVMTGPRVIVAASSAESSHLTAALHVAEEAAVVADKFAHWNRTDVYIVYLASVKEAGSWLGGVTHANQYTGTINPVTDTDIESLMIMPAAASYAGPGGLAYTMRWTFGKAAVDAGVGEGGDNDSLTAGMAEYIATYGHSGWLGNEFSGIHSFVRSSKWNKSVVLTKELQSTASDSTRRAARGIGFYALTRMVQKYGLAKTLDFWGYVERNSETLQEASQLAFGTPWATVNADCVAYIKSKA
jgi:hypothetical protein